MADAPGKPHTSPHLSVAVTSQQTLVAHLVAVSSVTAVVAFALVRFVSGLGNKSLRQHLEVVGHE